MLNELLSTIYCASTVDMSSHLIFRRILKDTQIIAHIAKRKQLMLKIFPFTVTRMVSARTKIQTQSSAVAVFFILSACVHRKTCLVWGVIPDHTPSKLWEKMHKTFSLRPWFGKGWNHHSLAIHVTSSGYFCQSISYLCIQQSGKPLVVTLVLPLFKL